MWIAIYIRRMADLFKISALEVVVMLWITAMVAGLLVVIGLMCMAEFRIHG